MVSYEARYKGKVILIVEYMKALEQEGNSLHQGDLIDKGSQRSLVIVVLRERGSNQKILISHST